MAAIVANCAISLNCELTRPVSVEYINGNVFSQDNAGNTVHVYVHYNGEEQEIVGSVSANVIRADGTTVAVPGAIQGNRAYVIFPQAVYAVPGVISVAVKVTEGTTVTTIAAFVANVYRSSTDTIVDPGTIIPSVQNLIAAIDAAIASIPADYSALLAQIAPTYSTTATYPVTGKIVWYDGTLYENIVPITSGETFDPEKWKTANLGRSIFKNHFDAVSVPPIVQAVSGATPYLWEYGYYYTTGDVGTTVTKTGSNAYACVLIPATPGEKVTMNVTGLTGSNRAYCYVSEDMKVVARPGTNLSGRRTVTIPEGAAYIAVNNRLASQPEGFYVFKGTAVVDTVNDYITQNDKNFGLITELVPAGYITPIDRTVVGLTAKSDGDTFTIYGQPEGGRWWSIFNGADSVRTANASFLKTFDPGTYYFNMTGVGTKPTFSLIGTYSTVNNGETILNTDNPSVVVTFTDPANVLLVIPSSADYGTEENPTTYTITIKKLSAIDHTAREANETNAASVAAALAEVATKAPAIIENASGTIAHFTDGADMPLQLVTASMTYKQAGTGDPSPENIRQISGATSYKFNVAGKNIFGGVNMMNGIKATLPNATINESAQTVVFAASTTVSADNPRFTDLCGLTGKFKERTQYTFILTLSKTSGTGTNVAIEYTDGTLQAINGVSGTGKQTIIVQSAAGTGSAFPTVKGIRKNNHSGTTTLYCAESGIVESGYFAPAAKGALYEIEFPTDAGEVFGGTLQVNADGSGTLSVNRGMYVFDGASKIMTVSESSSGIMAMRSNYLDNLTSGDTTTISNQYSRMISSGSPTEGTAIRISDSIFVYDNRFVDLATAAAICEENPIQVCYALATPIVYNFTAGQIKSVLGENNVWAETGDITLKYAADTKLYIDAAIAAAVGS